MASVSTQTSAGPALREWRQRRRLTQLELALDAGVSTRHLSFIETGRSKPGRETLLKVLERLEVPFREQNQLLLAEGHAPAFPERDLQDPELAPVRDGLDRILAAHDPYPGMAVDRMWNVVAANQCTLALTDLAGVDPALLEEPVNAVRIGLHPRGLAPVIANIGDWRAFFLDRLERQLALTGDMRLVDLIEEVSAYELDDEGAPSESPGLLRVHGPGGRELSFFGMFASFDAPFEVTTSELALELLFPADDDTREALQGMARAREAR